jgi:two-component system NtrC family response regulator
MRRLPRVSVDIPFVLFGSGISCEGKIVNMSLSGARLDLPNHSNKLKSLVNLKFRPPNQGPEFEVLARVVRHDSQGVGVEFLDLDQHAKARLWDNILYLLPKNLDACPYCGKPLTDRDDRRCPHCRHSLAFAHKEYLANVLEDEQESEEMIGTCQPMRDVFHLIRKVATSDVSVLITGASGTGKEMVARAIHERSHRGKGPFVPINCGAIPSELLESELFGYEKGAFTGAYRTTIGTVERARGGTLFLDEVGEFPPAMQVKLLRFLQEFSFTRVGGRQPIQVDLRIISATNCDLQAMTLAGRFREDLYYRLDVINIHMPPLRHRGDDSLIMANVFLKRYAKKVGKDIRGFNKQATTAILTHQWTGNVRELINRVRRGVVLAEGPWLTPENLGLIAAELKRISILDGRGLKEAKAEFEAKLVAEVLTAHQGNANLAIKDLKISRSMLYLLVQKYNLSQYLASPYKPDANKKQTRAKSTRSAALV